MKKTALLALVSVAMTLPAVAQNKIDNRLGDSAEVLKQILLKPDEIPQAYLDKSVCVLIFPGVKDRSRHWRKLWPRRHPLPHRNQHDRPLVFSRNV